jgi:hypothetical protein
MHHRYEDFASQMISALEKTFNEIGTNLNNVVNTSPGGTGSGNNNALQAPGNVFNTILHHNYRMLEVAQVQETISSIKREISLDCYQSCT